MTTSDTLISALKDVCERVDALDKAIINQAIEQIWIQVSENSRLEFELRDARRQLSKTYKPEEVDIKVPTREGHFAIKPVDFDDL